MKRCDWCLVNAGRTHAERQCCRLRALAQAPSRDRLAFEATLPEAQRAKFWDVLIAEERRIAALKGSR